MHTFKYACGRRCRWSPRAGVQRKTKKETTANASPRVAHRRLVSASACLARCGRGRSWEKDGGGADGTAALLAVPHAPPSTAFLVRPGPLPPSPRWTGVVSGLAVFLPACEWAIRPCGRGPHPAAQGGGQRGAFPRPCTPLRDHPCLGGGPAAYWGGGGRVHRHGVDSPPWRPPPLSHQGPPPFSPFRGPPPPRRSQAASPPPTH